MLKIVNSINATSYLDASEHEKFLQQCVSTNAVKVLERLQKSTFKAYLVGGAVRDILLNKSPKDFDVATDATPEQIRSIFKNSRIIGRRFQIVHIRFGREIIEVTTFRGSHKQSDAPLNKKISSVSKDGMLLRDNVFGSVEEDAERRDFTINALYYDAEKAKIYDFLGGINDIQNKTIKLIGDPDTRFKEDPVRILRAIRFSSKLDFAIDPSIIDKFASNAPLLKNISPARLFDESLKLYISGQGLNTFRKLSEHDLLHTLLFNADIFAEGSPARKLVDQALKNTDDRLSQGKSITPAFIYAVFLWPSVRAAMKIHEENQAPTHAALHLAATEVMANQSVFTGIPKRFQSAMREIWELQFRLPNNQGKKAFLVFEHPRFRAGYDFLLLREQAGEIEPGLGDWWTKFQEENPAPDRLKKDNLSANRYHKKPRRRNPPKK